MPTCSRARNCVYVCVRVCVCVYKVGQGETGGDPTFVDKTRINQEDGLEGVPW